MALIVGGFRWWLRESRAESAGDSGIVVDFSVHLGGFSAIPSWAVSLVDGSHLLLFSPYFLGVFGLGFMYFGFFCVCLWKGGCGCGEGGLNTASRDDGNAEAGLSERERRNENRGLG